MTECGKRQVDLDGFLKSITSCSSLALTFTSSQVDDVQLSYLDVSLTVFSNLRRLNCNSEDRVRSRTVLVHVGCAYVSVEGSLVKDIHQVGW